SAFDVVAQVGDDGPRAAVDAEPGRQAHERGGELRVLGDVDGRAGHELGLHLLGQHRAGGKAPNELKTALAQTVGAALVGADRGYQVVVAAGGAAAAVDAGEQGATVRYPAATGRGTGRDGGAVGGGLHARNSSENMPPGQAKSGGASGGRP